MKRILCLFTIVFLSSCATGGLYKGYILDSSDDVLLTKIPTSSSLKIANKNSIPDDYLSIKFNLLNNKDSFLEAYISPRTFESQYTRVGGIHDLWIRSAINLHKICEIYSNDICLLYEFNGNTYFLDEALAYTCTSDAIRKANLSYDIKYKIPFPTRCAPFIEEEENKKMLAEAKKKEDEEQKRLAVVFALEQRCIEYGFTGNNNIASCIQREAQHDFEIEQQRYQVELLKQQLASQTNQANTNEEIPFWMEILGAVADGISEGYKQKQLIETLDSRYQRKSIYRYQPSCINGNVYGC
tara:strand:+ start:2167 stop:3060 length:894 start_codon:yes stop_codon:yes gene_type:complete